MFAISNSYKILMWVLSKKLTMFGMKNQFFFHNFIKKIFLVEIKVKFSFGNVLVKLF